MNKSEQAYRDFYHKIKASVSLDEWNSIWSFIEKRVNYPDSVDQQNPVENVRGTVPSDEDLLTVIRNVRSESPEIPARQDIAIARALLSRYGNQPVQPESRRDTLLDVIQTLKSSPYSVTKWDCLDVVWEMLDEADQCNQPDVGARPNRDLLQQFFDVLDDALFKERASPWTGLKGAKFQDRMLVWKRVQELRDQLLVTSVAQEPVGEVRIEGDYWNRKGAALFKPFYDLPVWTKLYAAPVAYSDPSPDAIRYRNIRQAAVTGNQKWLDRLMRALPLSVTIGGQNPTMEEFDAATDAAGECPA